MMQTLDQRQATDRLEEHVSRAVAALPVTPRLEIASDLRTECDDPSDLGPQGRIQVSRRYWLAGLDRTRNAECFEALHAHWTTNGYRVLDDARDRSVEDMETGEVHATPMLWVEHADDGFRMNLVSSVRGDLSLVTTSPCIWPTGEPEPAA
ncbi:MAG TPA: hypothetical protein VGD67_24895 [Pseudonocardiaceae bacterium]